MRRIIIATIFASATIAAVVAEEAAPISLERAREAALKNSQTVKQAELAVRSGLYGETSAKADLLPSISASAGLSGSLDGSNSLSTTPSVGISASQTLYSGGAKFAALENAKKTTEKASAALLSARLSVLTETDTRFLDALETERSYDAALKSLDAAEKRLQIAQAKKAAGTISASDFLETQSTWASTKTAATQAKYAALASRKKLASYIGLEVSPAPMDDEAIDAVIAKIEKESNADLDGLIMALFLKGKATNPDLRQMELAVDMAELAVRVKKADYFPTVSVSASYKASSSDYSSLDGSTSLGLSASIPLFPISDRSSAVADAKVKVDTTRSALVAEEEDLYLSFYTSTLNLLSASGSIASAEAAVSYAEENYKLVLEKFKLSSATASDVVDAEATLMTAQNGAISARFDLYTATLELARLLGAENERGLLDALP